MPEHWERHEAYVCDVLGLSGTVASGSQWNDIGDATDREGYDGNPFRLLLDAKCTVKKSFSVQRDYVRQWFKRAEEKGKRFGMPIRFVESPTKHEDYILLGMDDFVELLELAKNGTNCPGKHWVEAAEEENSW